MTDRSRAKKSPYKSNCSDISRRDVLRAGASIIPACLILPAWLTANAQTTSTTFDYYISPTGSDANPGTLASPWAITSLTLNTKNAHNVANCHAQAGKRIGFLPGTYDLSGLMELGSNAEAVGALQLIGGSSSALTYWGSSDSSGNYSARTATLDAKGASGLFGGGRSTGPGVANGPMVSHCGAYPVNYAVGYATIDGLRFTGFSYKGVRIGGGSSGDGPTITSPVTVQNCEFTGGGFNSGDAVDNCDALWIDHNTNAVTVTNNWFHDSAPHTPGNGDHCNAIIVWGFGGSVCTGTMIQFNTCVNAGNIYGKEGGIQGTTIQNNYIDVSMYASSAPGIQDFTGNGQGTSGLTATTVVQNNVVICHGGTAASTDNLCGISTLSGITVGWMTPVIIRNNTVVNASGSGALVGFTQVNASSAGVRQAKFYNNLYANPGGSGGSLNGWGNYRTNPQALALSDYNLNPASGVTWVLSQNASPGSTLASYSSNAAFAAGLAANGGISGAEAHSIAGTPTFVGTGTYAMQYQLASGSKGKGTGSTNGTSGGSATDMGAWGNGATQVGCNFAGGAKVPDSPSLTVS